MPVVRNAGLRSDGELVQAVSETNADSFEFVSAHSDTRAEDKGHGGWIEIVGFSAPTRQTESEPDDDGLPDTNIWDLDGNTTGTTGSASGEELVLTHEFYIRTWSVDGDDTGDAGMSALLFF